MIIQGHVWFIHIKRMSPHRIHATTKWGGGMYHGTIVVRRVCARMHKHRHGNSVPSKQRAPSKSSVAQ